MEGVREKHAEHGTALHSCNAHIRICFLLLQEAGGREQCHKKTVSGLWPLKVRGEACEFSQSVSFEQQFRVRKVGDSFRQREEV